MIGLTRQKPCCGWDWKTKSRLLTKEKSSMLIEPTTLEFHLITYMLQRYDELYDPKMKYATEVK